MRLAAPTLFLIFGLVLPPAYGQQLESATVPVGIVVAEKKPVTKAVEFVGRVEAINRVEIKARVTGYLEEVLFKEGDDLKEGAPLYRIEKGLFDAAVKQAEGALDRANAAKVLTGVQLERAERLVVTQAVSAADRDRALAADEQAKGAILEAEANLQSAKINLAYTDIVSPISGKIGRTSITKGNVVGPEKGTLTTIVSQDPMYVTFPVSQREFLLAQQTGRGPNVQGLKVKLRYSDGTLYDQTGTMNFIDVTVDRSTDTVIARATIPNPRGGLVDGQLMTVVIEAGTPDEKIVIPQSALLADQGGVYVFVIEGGKAAIRRIKTSGLSGNSAVVATGLSGGEQVIVEGLQAVTPGISVRASPVPAAPGGN
jgi:membrane fusion protein, multidrug efflux system